jgi:phospholipase D1/2
LPGLFPCTHHQKLAVFDKQRLYIGGLDLNERRYDTPTHGRAGHQTWHDVQLLITGPIAVEAHQHLTSFRDIVVGHAKAPVLPNLLRTISSKRSHGLRSFGPEPIVQDLRRAHFALILRATTLIYLESQYFRDRSLARLLARRARENPQLNLILILPAAPDEVAFDGKRGSDARFGEGMQALCLGIIRRAFGPRLFVGSPAQPRVVLPNGRNILDGRDRLNGAPLIHVHAKVSVFDDHAAIVSSANLNGRSMKWDTEAGVVLSRPTDVADLRQRVMAHWLPKDAVRAAFGLDTALSEWQRIAQANARVKPEARQGFLLPHDFAAAEAFGKTLPILPEEMV